MKVLALLFTCITLITQQTTNTSSPNLSNDCFYLQSRILTKIEGILENLEENQEIS